VATDSQGITLAWAGSALAAEIVSLSVDGVSHGFVDVTPRSTLVRARQHSPHDTDAGTVSVTMRAKDVLSGSTFGTPQSLSITRGTATYLTAQTAYLKNFAWSASLGELQEYRATFRLSGTVTI
jgi:hypothetical protein